MIEKVLLILILYNTIDKEKIRKKVINVLEFYREYKKKENTTNEKIILNEWEKGGLEIDRIRVINSD